ncbi:MAG: hypothetical protein U0894_03355 [Pirellulales bacterium]
MVTGLNMMPVSQLDGGHVTYALFGKYAHWIARGFMVFVFAYFAYTLDFSLSLMAVLVLLLGTDHPPTRDDSRPLGWVRTLIGFCSLIIPWITFALTFSRRKVLVHKKRPVKITRRFGCRSC